MKEVEEVRADPLISVGGFLKNWDLEGDLWKNYTEHLLNWPEELSGVDPVYLPFQPPPSSPLPPLSWRERWEDLKGKPLFVFLRDFESLDVIGHLNESKRVVGGYQERGPPNAWNYCRQEDLEEPEEEKQLGEKYKRSKDYEKVGTESQKRVLSSEKSDFVSMGVVWRDPGRAWVSGVDFLSQRIFDVIMGGIFKEKQREFPELGGLKSKVCASRGRQSPFDFLRNKVENSDILIVQNIPKEACEAKRRGVVEGYFLIFCERSSNYSRIMSGGEEEEGMRHDTFDSELTTKKRRDFHGSAAIFLSEKMNKKPQNIYRDKLTGITALRVKMEGYNPPQNNQKSDFLSFFSFLPQSFLRVSEDKKTDGWLCVVLYPLPPPSSPSLLLGPPPSPCQALVSGLSYPLPGAWPFDLASAGKTWDAPTTQVRRTPMAPSFLLTAGEEGEESFGATPRVTSATEDFILFSRCSVAPVGGEESTKGYLRPGLDFLPDDVEGVQSLHSFLQASLELWPESEERRGGGVVLVFVILSLLTLLGSSWVVVRRMRRREERRQPEQQVDLLSS